MRSWPEHAASCFVLPQSASPPAAKKCWRGVFASITWCASQRAARADMTSTSPPLISYAPYWPSGSTKQLVWPYIVSGRSVAGARKTSRPSTALSDAGNGASSLSLMSVYSCGPTPSPSERSWSAHTCPSSISEGTF